ncbi:MAG: PASTA domain-containing protein [Gaiellaceae bacterium]
MRKTRGPVVALAAICVLVSAGLTIAASRSSSSKPSQVLDTTKLPTKIVPDVIGQPYVFAESMLQANGFGWRVEGPVAGWAEALVSRQEPVANTEVLDTGAPLVKLQLAKPKGYQSGTPESASPYAGTKIVLPSTPGTEPSETTPPITTTTKTEPVEPKPKPRSSKASTRPRAFVIAGAKSEPLDEIPLPRRARNLDTWLDSHRQASDANERYWLYQHAWIVTGAKFGWWHGAQALETLIAVDKRIEALWGLGSRSEAEARAALEFVRARGG